MTTNKPEVVAWRWRKPVVNDQGETVGGVWKLGGAPAFLPWWTNDPLIRLSDYEALQAEYEKLRKDVERYRYLLEEPVGYVSPHLLDTLRSGKACGITMTDAPDVHNGVTIPLYTAECGCCGQMGQCDDDCDAVVIGGHRTTEQRPDVAGLAEARELLLILRGVIGGATWTLDDEENELAVRVEKAVTALAAHRKQGGEE